MKADEDGFPRIGRSSRELGVRVVGLAQDVPVGPNDEVRPLTGGMSVAADDARNLPKHRLPFSLGGDGPDPVFATSTDILNPALQLRVDRYPHALVEPSHVVTLRRFEADLAATRGHWSRLA